MKIKANQIPAAGLILEEEISPADLDVETKLVKLDSPVKIKADIYKITNAVNVDIFLTVLIRTECSRCLDELKIDLKKKLKLNYQVSGLDQEIDVTPEIREELLLNYPIKPLCKPDCKGLCPKCGEKLNEGGCSCGIT